MQLKLLTFESANEEICGSLDVEITSLCYDSQGGASPARCFSPCAAITATAMILLHRRCNRGAVAVVVERVADLPIAGCDAHRRGRTCANHRLYWPHSFTTNPRSKLKLAGITGTNGKTTTTYLLKHICERASWRCGLIGTVRYEIGDEILPSARTTPESLDLQSLLARMRDAGCKAAVMEVSSHAIAQDASKGRGIRCGGVHKSDPGPSRFSRQPSTLFRDEGRSVHSPSSGPKQESAAWR